MRRVKVSSKLCTHFCILSSAAFYAASFLFDFCWWGSFFCFVPLFSQRFSSYSSAVYAGFLWGVIAYGLTLSALLEVIIRLGEKPLRYLYAVGFLGYFVFFSVAWCVLARDVSQCTKSWGWGWFLSTLFYFSWMYSDFFYVLTGHRYGYPLACPLLPLMKVPAFLGLVPVVGWCMLLGALLCWQIGVVQREKVLMSIGILPFLLGFFVNNQSILEQHTVQNVVMISRMFYEHTPYERVQELCDAVRGAQQLHPEARIFVLPESAFPFPLNEYRYVQELLSEASDGKYVVLGSHFLSVRADGKDVLYNSAYVLHAGRVLYRYDKKLLLPFFEEQPLESFFLQKTQSPFLMGKRAFTSQSAEQQSCFLPESGTFSFRICSELLWDLPVGKQIFVLVNDSHYIFSYFPKIFRSFAQFQALEKGSTLYYCGWQKE